MRFLIIGIVLFTALFSFFLKFLNYTWRNKPLPANVKDVFEPEAYKKNQAYGMENLRFSIVDGIIGLIISVAILVFNFHHYLFEAIQGQTTNVYLQGLFIMGVPVLIGIVVDQITSIYSTFVIEEKYGFNKTTVKTFIIDFIKSLLLSVIVMGGLLTGFLMLYNAIGNGVFIAFFFILVALMIFVNFISPFLIRIFYKLTPLEDGSLKARIEEMAEKTGFKLKGIYKVDASKRSTKLNAFASGFGKTKTIGLFDTLIEKMSEDEILAVLAHEIGHAKKSHILKSTPLSFLSMALVLVVAYFVVTMPEVSMAFGFYEANATFGIYVLFILVSPLMILLSAPASALSRKHEYEADRVAATLCNKEDISNSLKTLYRESFGNLTPHPFVVAIEYSHPPLSQRLSAIEALK